MRSALRRWRVARVEALVAMVLPLDTEQAEREMVEAGKKALVGDWDRYERPAEELRQAWPAEPSTGVLIDAIRR